jgi:branched-subunit amino acid aminotransferase/4-amino-4-deoxychorismate lyase
MLAFRLSAQRLVPIESESDSPDELTRRLPRGLYTTFSTNHNGTRVLGLSAHLERLYASTESAPAPSASPSDLRRALAQLTASNAPGESRFRLLRSLSDGAVYVIVQRFMPPPREIYERGVKVVTAEMTRHDPRLKDSGFISESQSLRGRVGGEVYEVLLTKKGKIYEGMTSNFYVVIASPKEEAISAPMRGLLRSVSIRRINTAYSTIARNDEATLVTARTGILLGVTRRAVLRLARGEGMSIVYRPPRMDEDFAEAFLTSSSRGIVPIISIDGVGVGEGRVGAWTKRLSLAYAAYVEERSEGLV